MDIQTVAVIVIAVIFAAWTIKRLLAVKEARAREASEQRDREERKEWEARMEVALQQSDVDAAVTEVMNQASGKNKQGVALDALVFVIGLNDEEIKSRKDAVFAGYKKAQQDMSCEVSAPVGLCMRPYKSVEENYQIGYRFVQEWGVPGEKVHINMSAGVGPPIGSLLNGRR